MLAQRPPRGWNSWNTFGSNISEELIFSMADAMVADGYLAAGYEYLVIDDCWSLMERSADGHLVPDPAKFPHGMKAVTCFQCGRPLSSDEIAVYRRLVNRAAEQCLCIFCFAKEFSVTEELIRQKIRQFKEMGCTLFSNSKS